MIWVTRAATTPLRLHHYCVRPRPRNAAVGSPQPLGARARDRRHVGGVTQLCPDPVHDPLHRVPDDRVRRDDGARVTRGRAESRRPNSPARTLRDARARTWAARRAVDSRACARSTWRACGQRLRTPPVRSAVVSVRAARERGAETRGSLPRSAGGTDPLRCSTWNKGSSAAPRARPAGHRIGTTSATSPSHSAMRETVRASSGQLRAVHASTFRAREPRRRG